MYIRAVTTAGPLWKRRILPVDYNLAEELQAVEFSFSEGNMSCDCNLMAAIHPGADWAECGDTIGIERLEYRTSSSGAWQPVPGFRGR